MNSYLLLSFALFVLKGTETRFFGAVPSWFIVFLPIVINIVFEVLEAFAKEYNWNAKIRFWIWKTWLRVQARRRSKQAIRDLKSKLNK